MVARYCIIRSENGGLDPPSEVVVLEIHSGVAATVNFGTTNPVGTSHYVRLGGAPTVYLMPRHVTEEWRLVFDMTRRLQDKAGSAVAGRGPDLLLLIEISDTTLAHDMRRKADLYRQYGVREYWVVDVNAGLAHVHRLDGAWPAAPAPLTGALTPSLIPGFSITIADFLPR